MEDLQKLIVKDFLNLYTNACEKDLELGGSHRKEFAIFRNGYTLGHGIGLCKRRKEVIEEFIDDEGAKAVNDLSPLNRILAVKSELGKTMRDKIIADLNEKYGKDNTMVDMFRIVWKAAENLGLNEFAKMVNELAHEKGWYDDPNKTKGDDYANFHAELSEGWEQVKNGMPPLYFSYEADVVELDPCKPLASASYLHQTHVGCAVYRNNHNLKLSKPEGELSEFCDVIIRVIDNIAENEGWDLEGALVLKHSFNETRDYRHGNKVV